MKVLILSTDLYTRGGIARYTSTLAWALADLLGHENVDVLVLLACGDPSDLRPRYRVLGPVTDRLTPMAKVRFANKALALARARYDLILCNHLGLAPIGAAIRFLYGTPFWVVCHGSEAWSRLPLLKRAALRQSELLLAVSRFTAGKLAEVHGIPEGRISILYNTIPQYFVRLLTAPSRPEGAESAAPTRERILLSVGTLSGPHAYKGFDTVIRALPRVLAHAGGGRYLVVGRGNNRASLERLAAEVGVADRVTFAGQVSDAELADLYRSCEVFVMPSCTLSVRGRARGEGFGRVFVEAALAGKPVVGSCEGGAAEAVLHGKTGLLVDPRSVEEVGDAVVTLLSDAELAASMGAAGRKWAQENFTQEALRRRLAELLERGFGGGRVVPQPGLGNRRRNQREILLEEHAALIRARAGPHSENVGNSPVDGLDPGPGGHERRFQMELVRNDIRGQQRGARWLPHRCSLSGLQGGWVCAEF
jgi:glycosyltransferase involved in cell wall biosynthesis